MPGYGKCKEMKRLEDKIAILTDCSSRIGIETAGELARRGCTVIITSRDMETASVSLHAIEELYSGDKYKTFQINDPKLCEIYSPIVRDQLIPMELDMAQFKSIIEFTKNFKMKHSCVDFLICNSNIIATNYEKTLDQLEMHMASNHLGHVLLTELLMDCLKRSDEPRVIMTSSKAHIFHKIDIDYFMLESNEYSRYRGYANSKIANILYAKHLAYRETNSNLLALSLHPGFVENEFPSYFYLDNQVLVGMAKPFFRTYRQASQTIIFCCTAAKQKLPNGEYFVHCKLARCAELGKDLVKANKFIKNTLNFLKGVSICQDFFSD